MSHWTNERNYLRNDSPRIVFISTEVSRIRVNEKSKFDFRDMDEVVSKRKEREPHLALNNIRFKFIVFQSSRTTNKRNHSNFFKRSPCSRTQTHTHTHAAY